MNKTYRLLMPLFALLLLAACGRPEAGQPEPAADAPPAAIAPTQPDPATAAPEAVAPVTDTVTDTQPEAITSTGILTDTGAAAEGSAETMSETVDSPQAVDVTSVCPEATEGTTLYTSTDNGFCMLYPSGMKLSKDTLRPGQVMHLIGSPADPNAMETVVVNLGIAQNGPADGIDATQYAATWQDFYMPWMDLPQEPATIGGNPAVLMDTQPGMFPRRSAFLVVNDVKYQIDLEPQPEMEPRLTEEATLLWDTVTQSIVFFPPQNPPPVVRPSDVCPSETPDTKLIVDLAGGYCLLYPADFAPNPDLPGQLAGGPELGPVEGFDTLRASLTVGSYGLGEQTPEQVLQPMNENIDPASLVSTTIGGYPATIFDFIAGPWRQRNAIIVVDDNYYSFVAQPWDPEMFPQALPDVERIWQMATETIAFFDKWY